MPSARFASTVSRRTPAAGRPAAWHQADAPALVTGKYSHHTPALAATAASAASSCGPQSSAASRTRPRSALRVHPNSTFSRRRGHRRPARCARCRPARVVAIGHRNAVRRRIRASATRSPASRSGGGRRSVGDGDECQVGRRPNTRSSSALAMSPSFFCDTISQSAPAGCSRRAGQVTAASVCPGRRSTPPALARSGSTVAPPDEAWRAPRR